MAVILAGATCRLDKLIIGPQGALLAVTPSMPDSLVDSAAFGSTAIQVDSAHITNDGGGELSWTATIKHASPWLSLDTSSGVAPYYLKVLANPTGLDSGDYRDTVVVSSTVGGGALEVPVRLNVHSCRSVPIALDDSISSALTTADCGAPHRPGRFAKLFSFPGTINDSVTIELSEGYGGFVALDTSLVPAAPPLDSTGTCLGTPGSPCLYYQRLPRNATYYIEVTSADSADTGPFTLRLLHARDPNPADSLDQRLADSVTAIDTGATISQNSVLLRAVVSDPDRGDTLHLEAEVRPTNIQFTGSPTQIGPEVTAGQIAWVQITGLSDNTSYHWCVRVVDQTGNGSECISFGGNQESETDFRVAVPTPPALPTGLGQSKGDGTPIQLGQVADTDVVLLSATVNDADPGDQIRLQVEVQPIGTLFTDSPTDSGDAVLPGPAQVFVGPLGNNTSYHWQVRASDLSGSTSNWVRFGGNPEPNGVDFTIQVPNLPNAPTTLAQFQNDGTTPITKGGVTVSNIVVLKGVVSDPDVGQQVQLEVEVRPVTQNFTNTANFPAGALVANGATASVTVGPLNPNTDYHWQGRARDATGRPGAWVSFPSPPAAPNPENEADFRVQQPPSEIVFTVQPPATTGAGVTMTPPIQVTARDINGNTSTGFTGDIVMTLEPNPGGAVLLGTTTVAAVNGVAQFNDLRINKSGTSYVMRATAPSLGFFRTSTAFSITAGPTTQLVFTGQPSNAVAGASIAPPIVVSAQDVFFNTTTFGGSVTLTIATNPGVPPGTLTGGGPVTALNGVATFSGVSINKTGVGYTLRAGSGTLTPDTSVAFTITPGPVTHLTFVVQPATTAAGSPITPAVQVAARDANENTVTSFTSNVTMAIGTNPPGNGILSGTLTVPAEAGVAAFSNLNIDKVGTGYTLTATSAPFAATSTPFNIITSPISNTLSTVVATSPITACAVGCSTVGGTASLITVTARDGSGNAVQGATVVLSATGTGNTLTQPATTTNASGVATGTLSSTSTIDAKIVSAVIGGVAILDTDTVTVNPGPAASLAFTPEPGTTTAGVAINSGSGGVVVTARDQFDNTATSFGSLLTMVLGANPAGGALSGTLTATPTAGVATFQDLRITKAGTGYRLQASGGALTSPLSSAFTITTAPVSKLAFIVQPVTTADSAPITPAVQVAGQDSVGNTVTTFTGLVRMFIDNPGTNPGGGTLSGTTQVNATAGTGVATFSNLRINALGTGYTLLTTSSGLTDDVSAPFDIIPGPAVALFFTVEPSQTVAGSAISPAVQVTARDNQGNTATSFFGNVTLTIGTNPAGNGILTGGGPLAASAGIVSFPAASIDKAGSPYTLLANATGLTGATSIGFNVISGGVSPTLSTITRAPTSITASSGTITSTITVTARDNLNNAIQGATVVLSATGSGNSLIQPVATTNASGVATGTLASTVAETKTVSATIDGTLINATTTVGVNPAAPKLLLFNVHPNTTVATQTIRPATGVQVEVRDTFNNRVTGANISVNIAILNNPATPPGTLSGTTTATQANGRLVGGIATFNDLSIDKVGTGYTLLTSSTGLVSDTSVGFTITVGAATKLGFVQQPTSTSGGATISPAITVEILDAGNNRVNSTATVTLAIGTNPGPNAALSGTASLAAVAGLATFLNLSIDSAGTGYTLVATSGALTQATSGAFNITVGAATKLGFRVQPSNTAGGATITPAIEVEVRDAGGNRVTSASNLVDVAILNNAGGGTLAGDNSNNAVSGLATFNTLSINSAGTGYTLQATATGLTSAVSAGFNIAVGGATKLGFVQQPSNATGGATISPAVTVEIQDAGGNRVTGATNSVALAIGVNPGPGAALTGGNAVPAVNGLATFSNLSIDSAGTGYTLVATSGALTQATSTSFNITVGAATKLGFRVPPSNTAGGAVIAPAIEVEVQDAGGNRVTGGAPHTVDIAILNNPSTGVLTGDASNNTSGGVATFADLSIDVAANGYTLRATSTGLTSVTSTGFTIVVGAPAKLAFFQQPTNEIAGVSIAPAITVRVLDAGNNLVTTATNPVDVAILNNAGPGGTLSGDASNNASGGVATFTDLSIDKSGTGYTLRATSGSLTAVTSTGFDISHASADHLVFTVQPLNTQSGQTITPAVKVEIRDAFENLVTNATDDVTLAITNGTGTPLAQLSGTIPIAAVGGIATFSDLSIDLVGTGYTLDATAAGMSAATSDPFDITL